MTRSDKAPTRHALVWLTAGSLLAAVCGCMPSFPVTAAEVDSYWTVQQSLWDQAKLKELSLGGRIVPTRWVIRQHPSLVWSTITIVRAMDELKEGVREIDFAISPKHTDMLRQILADTRESIAALAELADPRRASSQELWTDKMAWSLTRIEAVARMAADPGKSPDDETAGMALAAEPLMQLISEFLNHQAEGGLLGEIDPDQALQLRQILVQNVLRLGFALAGRDAPEGLRETVTRMMEQTDRPDHLESKLRETLLEALQTAPPASGGQRLGRSVHKILTWSPKLFLTLEQLMQQWDRVEYFAAEFRTHDSGPVVGMTIKVKPGRQVRLSGLVFMQPILAVKGEGRMIIQPNTVREGETIISFEPVGEGGGLELRFEGLGYSLVRLLAMPLASGTIREIRIASGRGHRGERLLNVAVLMEAAGARDDPRRLLSFHRVRTDRIVRDAFSISSREVASDMSVSYLTPTRLYSYRRSKSGEAAKR